MQMYLLMILHDNILIRNTFQVNFVQYLFITKEVKIFKKCEEKARNITIEKHLEMLDWNLLCMEKMVCMFIVYRKNITQPFAKKFDGLL